MHRREVLTVSGALLLGGCSDTNLSGTEPLGTDITERNTSSEETTKIDGHDTKSSVDSTAESSPSTPTSIDSERMLGILKREFEENGITVQSLESNGTIAHLDHRSGDTIEGLEQGQQVAEVFEFGIKRGWQVLQLHVTLVDANGNRKASYRIDRWWVEQYSNYQMSGYELARRISRTVERTNDC